MKLQKNTVKVYLTLCLLSVVFYVYPVYSDVYTYKGKIDYINRIERSITVNDLPLVIDANTRVYSQSKQRVERYKWNKLLKKGKYVEVEVKYDHKLKRQRAAKIFMLE